MNTPDFPAWRARFAACGRRLRAVRQHSLHHLELLFGAHLPPGLLAQADEGPNSRERVFSKRRTFWGFLYQVLHPDCPCRTVVRQVQARCHLQGGGRIDAGTSACCQARRRLPVDTLQRLRHALAAQAGKLLPHAQQLWHGLCPKLMDGTAVSLPDTPANQRAYPQSRSRQPGCGFPLLKLVGLFSLVTTLTDPKLYPAGELARLDALRTAGRQAPTQALSPARQTPPSVPGAPASQSLLEEQPPEIKGLI